MPIVCIERPNRSRRRLYTARDAGRIACRVLEQGTATQEEILFEVYKCMDDPCSRGFWRDLLDAISVVLQIIDIILTSARVIRRVLIIIQRTIGRLPIVNVITRGLKKLLDQLEGLEKATDKLQDLTDAAQEVLEQLPE